MRYLFSLILCTMLAAVHLPAYAQAYPCSGPGPGEVVVGQTEAGNGVASVPLCQQVDNSPQGAAPQPQWQDRWGALASDTPRGILGTATSLASKDEAIAMAMSECHRKRGLNCSVAMTYSNQCIAMVVGDSKLVIDGGNTEERAIQKSMDTCGAESANCHVYYSACSPPQRIQ